MKKQPNFEPRDILALAPIVILVIFLTAGDIATGTGRVGWALVGFALIYFIGFIIGVIRQPSEPKFNLFFIPIMVEIALVGAGIGGILSEAPLHNSQAEDYKKRGNYEQAISEYRKGGIANLKTTIPEAYLLLGNQQLDTSKYEQALANYHNVSNDELMPNNSSEKAKRQIGAAYLAWGLQLEKEGKQEEKALAKYDEVLKDGNNSDAIAKAKVQARFVVYQMGDTELTSNNFEKAITTYQKAVNRYEATQTDLKFYLSKTYLAWGQKLLHDGDFEGALNKLEPNLKAYAVIVHLPSYYATIIDSYAGIGQKLLTAKKYDDLLTQLTPVYDTYVKLDRKNQLGGLLGNAYAGQAADFETGKNYLKAVEKYEKALTYLADNPSGKDKLYRSLVRVYMAQGNDFEVGTDYANAIAIYEKALTYAEGNDDSTSELNGRLIAIYQLELDDEERQIQEAEQAQQNTNQELQLALLEAGITGCSLIPGNTFCDVASLGLSLKQGDWLGAGLAAVGFIPFIGDAFGGGAKAAKIGVKVLSLESKFANLAKVATSLKALKVTALSKVAKVLTRGKWFSIRNWKNYPELANVPKPKGPFTLRVGADYEKARDAANKANAELHRLHLEWKGMEIHEIHPVKFGGSPTDISNKVVLSPEDHAAYTNWWNNYQKELGIAE
ncbi:MAG: hypothetical protein WCS37_12890 [Chloroflexota bacterium]